MLHTDLPSDIHSKAYVSPGAGEFAWRRSDVADAAEALAANGFAILGGEAWVVLRLDGSWSGLIPNAAGGPDEVWSWDTNPRSSEESWEAYCLRTAAESLDVLSRMTVEEQCSASVRDHLWFNLTWTSRHEV